ncbi:hypothetical protein Sked_20340 [Sanguibacter keddieii DSM 10542]|uniref:Cyclophilin-like domain-containing protein n=1 Tax=Sanguibacter keddieii (strain ATCC 51767 / DSM 10542 / NCFB 3025 / ST-74) TaxID=446469 RepID=D1BHN6_SANKS|nr:cyclophilin-like fold protein [Sanguibacter keddieii]ACZ21956.1 hypothetical protein Sked_20340 [Sanguibacter keddieii DSM 10542]
MRTPLILSATLTALLVLAGCGDADAPDAPSGAAAPSTSPVPSTQPSPSAPEPAPAPTAAPDEGVVGAVVRFSSGQTSIDVTIGEDNPTVRDLLSILPVTTTVEEFAGREKIAYLDRQLDTSGSPGSDPEDGDLIYFTPWGNLGLYYDASGIGYSDQTVHIGTYDASEEELSALEGGDVTISVVP